MNNFKQTLKTSLDERYFSQLTLNNSEARMFAKKVVSTPELKPISKFPSFVLPALTTVIVILIGSILLNTFLSKNEQVSAAIETEATKEFGQEVVIFEFDDYPITFASISKPSFLPKPTDLTLSYGMTKGEMDPLFAKEENRERWNKEQESELLYGPYTGRKAFSIVYRPGTVEVGDSDTQQRTINDLPVQYQHLERPAGEFVLATINAAGGSYGVEMNITKEFTLAESEKVLEEITMQLNK
ncbi:hypothetical protein A8F94_15050 [Bacillus sp. FJAT-27225]|uniref:hypothetical protein n=1 Tax=Bacillus sp. FJAT-27225 TaxID=1743144 RepID=UPI00080C34E3|nr:hypothetical protein [Bacillus sp. FJAT-27225]OCA84046.1 hypothetical protein A8F94_15050 [Bacillus sp. FJAT-27225]